MTNVDFVVNCYERTYRKVLQPGFVSGLAAAQQFKFASVTVLINNVVDREDGQRLADQLLSDDPGVTRVLWVSDHLDSALSQAGLRGRHIARLPHFTNCCLVAVSIDGPEWLCYWDADAHLEQEQDWITPTVAFMETNPRVLIGGLEGQFLGNPMSKLAEREAIGLDSGFALGYGFSDIAFLARRADLARPIYRRVAPASWRYPLAHVEPVFEQRIDAYMRTTGRLRATRLGEYWTHEEVLGTNYPASALREKVRRRLQRFILRTVSRIDHPALRPWPLVDARPTNAAASARDRSI